MRKLKAAGTRGHVVSVRFSEAELNAVMEGATSRGMSLSEFMRGVALADDAVPAVDFDELPSYVKDVLYGYSEGYKAALGERKRVES